MIIIINIMFTSEDTMPICCVAAYRSFQCQNVCYLYLAYILYIILLQDLGGTVPTA